jgi:hypothetical protein
MCRLTGQYCSHPKPIKDYLRIRNPLDQIGNNCPQRQRQVSTLSLVKAAVEGRVPRGIGIELLRDLPTEWSRQFGVLGLNPDQRKNETLSIFEDLLMSPVEGAALLLLEDPHWSDQTTQTLIER